jgi:hypothetical protein
LTVKMKPERSTETSACTYQTARHHIPKDRAPLNPHYFKNFVISPYWILLKLILKKYCESTGTRLIWLRTDQFIDFVDTVINLRDS